MYNTSDPEEFRLPVRDTLLDVFKFLWTARRDLLLMAAIPVVGLTIYQVAMTDLFGVVDPAVAPGPFCGCFLLGVAPLAPVLRAGDATPPDSWFVLLLTTPPPEAPDCFLGEEDPEIPEPFLREDWPETT